MGSSWERGRFWAGIRGVCEEKRRGILNREWTRMDANGREWTRMGREWDANGEAVRKAAALMRDGRLKPARHNPRWGWRRRDGSQGSRRRQPWAMRHKAIGVACRRISSEAAKNWASHAKPHSLAFFLFAFIGVCSRFPPCRFWPGFCRNRTSGVVERLLRCSGSTRAQCAGWPSIPQL
jgi:hypothetical protein